MKYNIKKGNIYEFDKLNNLWNWNNHLDIKEEVIGRIKNNEEDYFVIEKDGEFIGEFHGILKAEDEAKTIINKRVYLSAFRIHKDYQGQGLGTLLFKYILDYYENKGYTEFTIGVEDDNEIAKHIYKKFGFNKVIRRCGEKIGNKEYEYNLLLKKE
jgi:ribosomal protein S18 acetylase RimI-like enzyme